MHSASEGNIAFAPQAQIAQFLVRAASKMADGLINLAVAVVRAELPN